VRKVYSSHDGLLVGYLADLLRDQGIPCVVRNAYLAGASGELPPTECWPELWIADDRDTGPAMRLLQAYLAAPPATIADWTCPACGEPIEGQFTACWRCGRARPEGEGAR
jgi:hypothetical protein